MWRGTTSAAAPVNAADLSLGSAPPVLDAADIVHGLLRELSIGSAIDVDRSVLVYVPPRVFSAAVGQLGWLLPGSVLRETSPGNRAVVDLGGRSLALSRIDPGLMPAVLGRPRLSPELLAEWVARFKTEPTQRWFDLNLTIARDRVSANDASLRRAYAQNGTADAIAAFKSALSLSRARLSSLSRDRAAFALVHGDWPPRKDGGSLAPQWPKP
jgi:hypothetical protein